jgi:hypothetical protein
MFCIRRDEQEPVPYVDCEEGIVPLLRAANPGRYEISVFRADSVPCGSTFRRWGIGIKRADGSVVIEADPREA